MLLDCLLQVVRELEPQPRGTNLPKKILSLQRLKQNTTFSPLASTPDCDECQYSSDMGKPKKPKCYFLKKPSLNN